MKIARLAALIKEYKSATVLNTTVDEKIIRQHLVVSGAMYPLDGWPAVDSEQLMTIFDVPEDKRDEYAFRQCEHTLHTDLMRIDNGESDTPASMMSVMLNTREGNLIPFYTHHGVVFINEKYRKVIQDIKTVDWWLRELPYGGKVIIAKNGFQNVACICVEQYCFGEDEAEDLRDISNEATTLCERKREEDKRRHGEQQTM